MIFGIISQAQVRVLRQELRREQACSQEPEQLSWLREPQA